MRMPDTYDLFTLLKQLRMLCILHSTLPAASVPFTGPIDGDTVYEITWELVDATFELAQAEYREAFEEEKIYLSSEVMTEFYRLCREHASLLSVKLKDEPFYRRAETFVGQAAEACGDGYTYGVWLQTGIRHRWASGLVVLLSIEFSDWADLALALCEIPEYYRTKTEELKAAIAQLREKKQNETRCRICGKTPCS